MKTENSAEMSAIATQCLTRILFWWEKNVLLPRGFAGEVNFQGQPVPGASRGLILAARLLWTFSSAARITGEEDYRKSADDLYGYFVSDFMDRENGGYFAAVSPEGLPTQESKPVYGQAFAIYALSEYYRLTGRREALSLAMSQFDFLEKQAHDSSCGGYVECLHRDGSHAPELRGVNEKLSQEKTMNTSLHLLEAFTGLARVSGEKKVLMALEEMMNLFLEKICSPEGTHLDMFFSRDWVPEGDRVSFGHDIEASWLLCEAAELLEKESYRTKCAEIAAKICDHCLREGMTSAGFLTSEWNRETGERTRRYSWWEQNEAVVGFWNAWQLTGREEFGEMSASILKNIQNRFFAPEGGYYPFLTENLVPEQAPLASTWICPYHNSRMCMELLERIGITEG